MLEIRIETETLDTKMLGAFKGFGFLGRTTNI